MKTLLLVSTLLVLSACNSSPAIQSAINGDLVNVPNDPGTPVVASPISNTFIYRVNTNLNSISIGEITSTDGSITEHGSVSTGAGSAPKSVIKSIRYNQIYVANSGSNKISLYDIDSATGNLTWVTDKSTYTGPTKMVMHPSGEFLFTLHSDNSQISTHAVGANGALTFKSAISVYGAGANSIEIDANGEFIFANSNSYIKSFRVDQTNGSLTYTGFQSPNIYTTLKFHPTSQRLYGVSGMYNQIWAFNVDTSGNYSGSAMTNGSEVFVYRDLVFNKSGTKAYLINGFAGVIEAYSIQSTNGALVFESKLSLPSGCEPLSLVLLESENLVFTACTNGSGKTISYPLNSNGSLINAPKFSAVSGSDIEHLLIISF